MRILKDALIILYVIIAIMSTILLISFNKYKVSVFGDYSIVIVDNKELEPSFSKGDLVIVKSSDSYRVGENVFFYNVVNQKIEVTLANISKVEDVAGGMSAYDIPGGDLIAHDEVVGSISNAKVFHGIGKFVKFVESKYGYLILIVIPSAAAFLYEVYNFIVTAKEEKEEEEAEAERKKRLAKQRAKERLMARRQELGEETELKDNTSILDERKNVEEENEVNSTDADDWEEKQYESNIPTSRESLKASIEKNKKSYEEKIQKLKNSYGKKVEKHPEIKDDEDLKVTNQSDKIEKENDLKEKANEEAVVETNKPTRTSTSSVRRKIPSHGSLATARANAAKKSNIQASVKENNEEINPIKTVPTRKSGSVVAKRLAATRAANTETKRENPSDTSQRSTIAKRAVARRSARIQPKKNISSGKVDEKN